MGEEHKVVLRFRNKEEKQNFIGWFLDAGGSQRFGQYLEDHGKPCPGWRRTKEGHYGEDMTMDIVEE